MATIIKEKSSGEHYVYFHLYGMETGIYHYTICGFNGSNFFVKETKATDEKGIQCVLSNFDKIGEAPVKPIEGENVNVAFWNSYFQKLKNARQKQP